MSFDDGFVAAIVSKPKSSNPYNGEIGQQWDSGWDEAQKSLGEMSDTDIAQLIHDAKEVIKPKFAIGSRVCIRFLNEKSYDLRGATGEVVEILPRMPDNAIATEPCYRIAIDRHIAHRYSHEWIFESQLDPG